MLYPTLNSWVEATAVADDDNDYLHEDKQVLLSIYCDTYSQISFILLLQVA